MVHFWLAVAALAILCGRIPQIASAAPEHAEEPRELRWSEAERERDDDDDEQDGSWLRCPRGKVLVCHHRHDTDHRNTAPFELCVPIKRVPFHREHGDTLGPCPPAVVPCPESCDDVCPSACGNTSGAAAAENCTDGVNCWDLNGNGACDLPEEDKNNDRACTSLDCQGASGTNGTDGADGTDCWDLDGNGACDIPAEDADGDGKCTALDCRGAPGANCTCPTGGGPIACACPDTVKVCCYISVAGNPPSVPTFPVMAEIIWPGWNDCTQPVDGFLPCLGQFVLNPGLCALVLDKYGPGNATHCTLPDFSGMKIPQYMM